MTKEKIDSLLNGLMGEAKRQRSSIPYSCTDGFPQAVIFLGPNLEPYTHAVQWSNEREKYIQMEKVSKLAKLLFCQAVCAIQDTRWVSEEKICKAFGVPPSKEVGIEQFQQNWRRIAQERFKGYLGNAPKELYEEALVLVMKGPRIEGIPSKMQPYEEGPNDTIHWLPVKGDYRTVHFDLLPDWWV